MFSPRTGDYLYIERDKLGSGVEFDAVWEAELSEGRIRIVREEWCSPPEGQMRQWCTHGDGKLDIWVGAKLLEFGGHKYFIKIGNVRREVDVDLTTLRTILDGVREKKKAQR
jgi:hypothetical protein